MAPTIGWRHFHAIKQRKSSSSSSAPDSGGAAPAKSKQTVFVLMQASCDATAVLWVRRTVALGMGQGRTSPPEALAPQRPAHAW